MELLKKPKSELTHYLQIDYRISSLNKITIGLNESVDELKHRNKTVGWYDGIWLLEDSEPIYGLFFISLQNYIYGSIKDRTGTLNTKNKVSFVKKYGPKDAHDRSLIELIVSLANYYKHKDDGLNDFTKEVLNHFNLNHGEDLYIRDSPIFDGLDILDTEWNLQNIVKIVSEWREEIWNYD